MSNIIKSNVVKVCEIDFKPIDAHLNKEPAIKVKRNEFISKKKPDISKEEIADDILKKAKMEAEKMMATAMTNAQKIEHESFINAEKDGYEAGIKKGKEEIALEKEKLKNKRLEFENEKARAEKEFAPKINKLTRDLVEKITGIIVDDYEEVIYHIVLRGLKNIKANEKYLVKLSPADFEYMEENKEKLMKNFTKGEEVDFVAETSLEKNQCLIEVESNILDCSLSVQLENLITSLKIMEQ